ncbi:MAG TPA: tetratricopeptide repeat protein [Candidatus Marinimicrobia bacterium]|nr:tetratricopeptide repeat protein [Candidatus Neomarinimicrobiota bacterium]
MRKNMTCSIIIVALTASTLSLGENGRKENGKWTEWNENGNKMNEGTYKKEELIDQKIEEEWLEKAKKHYFDMEYEKAINYATEAIDIDSTLSPAYFIRGDSYGLIGDFNKALLDYNRAINFYPDYELALYQRAMTQFQLGLSTSDACNDLGKVKELISTNNNFQFLIDQSPDTFVMCELIKNTEDIDELLNIGGLFATGGKYLEAMAVFNEVTIRDPSRDKAYYNLSLIYNHLGNKEKELKLLLKTIKVNPYNDGAYQNLGQYYYELDNLDLSIKYTKKAAQLGNEDCQNWLKVNGY